MACRYAAFTQELMDAIFRVGVKITAEDNCWSLLRLDSYKIVVWKIYY
jgi:hypothetical protein